MSERDPGEEDASVAVTATPLQPAQLAVAMLLRRGLSPDEIEKVDELIRDGVTDVCKIVTHLDPKQAFLPWEEIMLNATFALALPQQPAPPIEEGRLP